VFAVLASETQTFTDEVNARVRVRERLEELFADPNVAFAIKCGKTISVPNHKMIPEVRWLTKKGPKSVVARSDENSRARVDKSGMAIFIVGRRFLENNTYGAFVEKSDSALIQVPPPGYTRMTTGYYFSTYWKCPKAQKD
jgi:hypothetical protein